MAKNFYYLLRGLHTHGYVDLSFLWDLFLIVLLLFLDTLILTAIIAGVVTWISGGAVRFGKFFSDIVLFVFIFEIFYLFI